MKITTKQPQGVPTWAELRTSDDGAALAFYGALFGWTDDPQQMPQVGTYHNQRLGDDDIVGIANQDESERTQGVPPHWSVYLAVDDAALVTGRVAAAGGAVIVPPFSMGEHGSMAVIADPTGGVVALAQSEHGFTRVREPGAVTWAELWTSDPNRAAAFFRTVLDVPTEAMDMGTGAPPYILLGPPHGQGAGIVGNMGATPSAWGVYFEVANTDAAVARAVSLGGTVVREPIDTMPGRFAVLADPQGAVFCVIRSNPMPGA